MKYGKHKNSLEKGGIRILLARKRSPNQHRKSKKAAKSEYMGTGTKIECIEMMKGTLPNR
jgi:hypothetical protein